MLPIHRVAQTGSRCLLNGYLLPAEGTLPTFYASFYMFSVVLLKYWVDYGFFLLTYKLLNFHPERCNEEGGGRGVHVWERMYTRGGFMSCMAKPTQYCKLK